MGNRRRAVFWFGIVCGEKSKLRFGSDRGTVVWGGNGGVVMRWQSSSLRRGVGNGSETKSDTKTEEREEDFSAGGAWLGWFFRPNASSR